MPSTVFPIHHTFGPLALEGQCALASLLSYQPWKLVHGKEVESLRTELSLHFGRSVSLFARGRDALIGVLRALNLKLGEEVIIQGYTCVVVPNAIHVMSGVPVYCDIERDTLSLDLNKLQSLITHRTRAIICQHTFGIPANTERLRAICDKRGIVLIEDCAHIIPEDLRAERQKQRPIGIHGDVCILSFGRDKAISGVTGGCALTQHPDLAARIIHAEREAQSFSLLRSWNHLRYPLRYRLAKKFWGGNVGKAYLKYLQVTHQLPPILSPQEKDGAALPTIFRIPNACAALALQQLRELRSINEHRRKMTALCLRRVQQEGWAYPEAITPNLPLQKFPVFASDADRIRQTLKAEQIHLTDGWNRAVVNPESVDQEAAGYASGSCPVSEDIARHIISIPTHPTTSTEQVEYVLNALQSSI